MTVFDKIRQFLAGRRYNYQKTFEGPPGEAVLKDLARFCRANETIFHESQRMTDVLVGRREVFLRISHHLNMTEEELFEKYK